MGLPLIARARLQASLACLAAVLLRCGHAGLLPATAVGLTAVLAVLAWSAPDKYTPVQRQLDRFVAVLLRGVSWVMLATVYFGLFTPLRAFRSLLKKDPLELRRDPGRMSYLKPTRPVHPRRFERQF